MKLETDLEDELDERPAADRPNARASAVEKSSRAPVGAINSAATASGATVAFIFEHALDIAAAVAE
ncbi:MAG: hypothetical protein GEU87_07135 [Alphaproteobacteria bacterium]|nr:hypothetical protein [Alphaproteobacteria bacterium]